MRAALVAWWRARRERFFYRLAVMLPRELCYAAGVRMLSEHCRAELVKCSRAVRAARAGHFRMVHVCEEFVRRRRG